MHNKIFLFLTKSIRHTLFLLLLLVDALLPPSRANAENLNLIYCPFAEQKIWFPLLADRASGLEISDLLFPALFGHDKNGNFICQLCNAKDKSLNLALHSWEKQENLHLSIELSPEFYWGDGSPLLAKDFYFTWALARSSHIISPAKKHWEMIKGIILDETNAKALTLVIPRKKFNLKSLSALYAISGSLVPSLLHQDPLPLGAYNRIPLKNLTNYEGLFYGPYLPVHLDMRNLDGLKRNSHYQGPGAIFENIFFSRSGQNQNDQLTSTLSKKNLTILIKDPLNSDSCRVPSTAKSNRFRTTRGPLLKEWIAFLNPKSEPLRNRKLWASLITKLRAIMVKKSHESQHRHLVSPNILASDPYIHARQVTDISVTPNSHSNMSDIRPTNKDLAEFGAQDAIKLVSFNNTLKEPLLSSIKSTFAELNLNFEITRHEQKKYWSSFEEDIINTDILFMETIPSPIFEIKEILPVNIFSYYLQNNNLYKRGISTFDAYLYLENGGYRSSYQQGISDLQFGNKPPMIILGGSRQIIHSDINFGSLNDTGLWGNFFELSRHWKL